MSNIGIRHNNVFSLLVAQEVQAAAGQAFKRETYDFFTAELVLEGCGWLSIGGRYYDVKAGDMYILPPGKAHEYAADRQQPWRKVFFNAGGSLISHLIDCYALKEFFFSNWNERDVFFRMVYLYNNLSDESHREAALIFHRLVALAAGTMIHGNYSEVVTSALGFIGNNLQNHIGLDDIARACFLSSSQLSRLFKRETGYTPCDYLCRKRIEMAKHLLRSTDLRIGDIAQQLQYADQFYFSSTFKKATGYSPSMYRSNSLVP